MVTVTKRPTEEAPEDLKMKHYILYKMDRTVALLGIIAIALCAMYIPMAAEAKDIAIACAGGLIGYIGGRAGNSQ